MIISFEFKELLMEIMLILIINYILLILPILRNITGEKPTNKIRATLVIIIVFLISLAMLLVAIFHFQGNDGSFAELGIVSLVLSVFFLIFSIFLLLYFFKKKYLEILFFKMLKK